LACTASACVIAVVIAGCGFHLRGDVQYTFKSMYLNTPAENPLSAELRRSLESGNRVQLAATPQAADVVVDVSNIADEKQVLSLSGGGRVSEYLLIKRATLGVHDASGRDWLPTATVQVRRSYTFNESEVLARESQEQR